MGCSWSLHSRWGDSQPGPQTGSHPITGDFDISAQFEIVSLDKPRTDDFTSIFLQLACRDQVQTSLDSAFNLAESGWTEAAGQLSQKNAKGEVEYRQIGNFGAKSLSGLRMTRREKKWTTLARTIDADSERIIGEIKLSDAIVPRARLLLHTGGKGRTSEILLKSFTIHAEGYSPPKPKGAVKSLLDLFK